jgi:nucleoside-diphosphate-sugar epimerase
MELLLTGSTGFVGRNLLIKLHRDPLWKRIILPVRDPLKLDAQLKEEGISDVRFRSCLVTGDFWELPPGVNPDLVIHAAGLLFGRGKGDYFATNVDGSIRLAAQLPHAGRMIVLSSLAAGGPTPRGVAGRGIEHDDRPISFYGASKLTMEKELRNRLGSRLLILRPPMVLGPRDAATLPLFRMASGPVRIKPGYSPKWYSWIAVDDLCGAILKGASTDWSVHRPFYLGAAETITDSQLIATAAEVVNGRGVTLSVPQAAIRLASLAIDAIPAWRVAVPSLGRDRVREILPDRWVSDGRPFEEHFGWKPSGGLQETLAETARWLRSRGKL